MAADQQDVASVEADLDRCDYLSSFSQVELCQRKRKTGVVETTRSTSTTNLGDTAHQPGISPTQIILIFRRVPKLLRQVQDQELESVKKRRGDTVCNE